MSMEISTTTHSISWKPIIPKKIAVYNENGEDGIRNNGGDYEDEVNCDNDNDDNEPTEKEQ